MRDRMIKPRGLCVQLSEPQPDSGFLPSLWWLESSLMFLFHWQTLFIWILSTSRDRYYRASAGCPQQRAPQYHTHAYELQYIVIMQYTCICSSFLQLSDIVVNGQLLQLTDQNIDWYDNLIGWLSAYNATMLCIMRRTGRWLFPLHRTSISINQLSSYAGRDTRHTKVEREGERCR